MIEFHKHVMLTFPAKLQKVSVKMNKDLEDLILLQWLTQ